MRSVTRATREHREQRANVTARIFSATEDLLWAGARFTEIPVAKIVSTAGVSRSTFYTHFPDKAALLLALAGRATKDLADEAGAWWRSDSTRSIEGIERTLADLIASYRRHQAVLIALGEAASYDDEARSFYRGELMRYVDFTTWQIRRDQSTGRVEESLDAARTAYAMVLMTDAVIRDHVGHRRPDEDVALAQALARASWHAIYGTISADASARAR